MVTKKRVVKSKKISIQKGKETIDSEMMMDTDMMMDTEMMIDTDMMMEEMVDQTKSGKIDFDKILSECLKKQDLFTSGMTKNEKNKMNKNYENSFDEIS